MPDKVKHVPFNEFMRKASKRYDLDKLEQELDEMSLEDLLKWRQRNRKELQEARVGMYAISSKFLDPKEKQRAKEIKELFDSVDLDGELDIKTIKILELIEDKIKESAQYPTGVLNRKGVFICTWCLVHEKYDDPISFRGFDTIIRMYDVLMLKAGSFYQCDDCKKKFCLNGMTD